MFGVCVLRHAEKWKTRVWIRKRLRVDKQNVSVCTGTTRTCVTTCGRGTSTHGDVLNLHTEAFWDGHTEEREGKEGEVRRGSPSVLQTMRRPT